MSVLHERARAGAPLVGHRVTTFPELTDALARDLGVSARVLDPSTAAVVLADALGRPGTPEPFRRPRRGLLRELLRVIEELEAAFLAPDDVATVAAALQGGPSASRLEELATVYAAYEASLDRLGAVDRHGRERRVCERLASLDPHGDRLPTLAGVERLVFAEIYDFSVVQFLIATGLIRLVGDAELVLFAHPENVDATRFLDRTWNRFVGDPAIADEVLPSFVVRGGRTGSLAAVLRRAFGPIVGVEAAPPAPGDGTVRLVVAPSRYGEVEAAVRDVRARLERGEPAERIALLARDLALYGDFLEDVCRRYRVPVYFRKGKPLIANGLVRACLDVLRCVVERFPRRRLESLLDADWFARVPRAHVHTLRKVGFVAEDARPLAECVARDPSAAGGRAAELVALVDELRALDAPRTVAGHAGAFRRALRRLGVRPVPAGDAPPLTAARDARAWELFQATVETVAGVTRALGGRPVTLAEFLRLLVVALEPLEVEDPAQRTGSVRALSVLDARGLDFDAVHLLGLDDGTFPAPRAESPLWPDAMKREASRPAAELLRRKLGARGEGLPLGGILRTAREASLEDPFLFFLALSMAEREIVLSYPAVDERGNPTVPSPFVDEVRRCTELPTIELDPAALVPDAGDACEPAELVARAALDRWSRRPGAPPDRLSGALAAADPGLAARIVAIDRRAAIEERRVRYLLTPAGHPAKDRLADAWVGRPGADVADLAARLADAQWSPRRLETLGTCGFKFFARYALGLGEHDDPDGAVGRTERGTLVHRVLERLVGDHPRLPADLADARALAREFLMRVRDDVARGIPPKDPALLDVAWEPVAAAVDALVVLTHAEQARDDAAGIVVEHVLESEVRTTLADPGGGPPLVVGGTPDRVDVRRRDGRVVGVRVVDYKTSRSHERYARAIDAGRDLGRRAFQIPVYLLAATAALGELAPDAELAGGYLVLLGARRDVVRPFARDELARLTAQIATLVDRARVGRFDVDPDPCDAYCRYRSVCRYQRPPLDEEVAGG
jgi:RecB family exonuclease